MADEIPEPVAAYAAGLLTAMGPGKLPEVATMICVMFARRVELSALQAAADKWLLEHVSPDVRAILTRSPR